MCVFFKICVSLDVNTKHQNMHIKRIGTFEF